MGHVFRPRHCSLIHAKRIAANVMTVAIPASLITVAPKAVISEKKIIFLSPHFSVFLSNFPLIAFAMQRGMTEK
jgi:hypothetical protein